MHSIIWMTLVQVQGLLMMILHLIPDIELDIADSPESSTTTTQTSVSTAELEEIPSKKKSSASTLKTKRPKEVSNHQKAGSAKDINLAMIQIAEKLQNESSEKPSSSRMMRTCILQGALPRDFKKLPERAQGYVRIQLEQLMFQVEFRTSPDPNAYGI